MIKTNGLYELQGMLDYLEAVPFDVTRNQLYAAADLYEGFSPDDDETFATCHDSPVYAHYLKTGKLSAEVKESLARTLHDHGMHLALDDFFKTHNPRLCLGVMGGHALLRTDQQYVQIVMLSKRLTELGFFMLSG